MRLLALGLASILLPTPGFAGLSTFQSFVGSVGYSSDGWGSTTQSGQIQASVPVGSTVLGAYLYSASFFNATGAGVGGTFAGSALTGGTFVLNTGVGGSLGMTRFDVTSIAAPIINGGPGGIYNFNVTESSSSQDGFALVVVYSNASLATTTVAILDGFSAAGGDSFTASFASPLNPAAPGFQAEMALGIGFSCCNPNNPTQRSNVNVNGTLITQNAGLNDDSADANPGNGNLITVGGFNDPFSTLLPSYGDDRERYNLVPYITNGDTSITVRTNNPSNDDNIFLAVFQVTGEAQVTSGIPEPSTYALFGSGLALAAFLRRRANRS